ncbi:MAG: RNA polymerase sigma factor [Chloroflexi bacterium]|nr:RNA polymerase sigma factor [Chloroflexota bacterium]
MAKQGKLDDFEQIFHEYKGWVYKTAYLIVQNPQQAEDIMQEVFVRAYKSNGTFDHQKGSYSTWLRRITINRCLNGHRNGASSTASIEEMEEQGQSIPDNGLGGLDQISLKDDIRNLIDSLGAKYRAALVLRCVDGLAYDEIAEVLGIPLGTVKSRINRAVEALREKRKSMEKEAQK